MASFTSRLRDDKEVSSNTIEEFCPDNLSLGEGAMISRLILSESAYGLFNMAIQLVMPVCCSPLACLAQRVRKCLLLVNTSSVKRCPMWRGSAYHLPACYLLWKNWIRMRVFGDALNWLGRRHFRPNW